MGNKIQNSTIYFDYNASTPIDKNVLDIMLPYFNIHFSNASSSHASGQTAKSAVVNARKQIANLISSSDSEIIFTSGATEAINIAIKGIAEAYSNKGQHIITVKTEHKAVLDTCNYLESRGYEVTYLSVDENGLINLEDLRKAIRQDTILVCIMYVNNETGVIQPIEDISKIIHKAGALFFCDATQAVGKIPINVNELGIDLLCMSGHKMYAPKGIGALYVNRNIKLPTFLHGGGHEKGIRSGTLNVPGIVALGKACEIAQLELEKDALKIKTLRDNLESELVKEFGAKVNGSISHRCYNVSNLTFPGIDASILIGKLDNVALSTGSACTSAIVEPSHVLKAMGLSDEDAFGTVRFSLGRQNELCEIRQIIDSIKSIINY